GVLPLAAAGYRVVELQRPLLRRAAAQDALPAGAHGGPDQSARPRRPAVPDPPPLSRPLGELPPGHDRAQAAGDGPRGRPARLGGAGRLAVLPAWRQLGAARARLCAQPPGRRHAGAAAVAAGRGTRTVAGTFRRGAPGGGPRMKGFTRPTHGRQQAAAGLHRSPPAMTRPILPLAVLLTSIAACSTVPPPGAGEQVTGTCNAEAARWTIGRAASPETVEDAR